MWRSLFLLFLVGAVSAEHFQAWKTDTQYEYHIRGRTLTALHDFSNQYTGIIVRSLLTIRTKNEDTLVAKISEARYARIHTKLSDGWESEIPDSMLDFKQLPMSEKVFEIKIRNGIVRDLIVDKDVSTWEVNVLKSIVNQLQVDTKGENIISSMYNQQPEKNRVNAMYKTMEHSVGGKCEVLYDINTLPNFVLRSRPELIPKSELRGNGAVIEIMKTKNYCNCQEQIKYHFGTTESNNWKPFTNDNGKFMSQSSVSRIVITGDLNTFTIQSSMTTHEVILSPNLHENKKGMVSSRVNVTLVNMGPVPSDVWSMPANLKSVGNLVYSYDNPFSGAGKNRHEHAPRSTSESLNSEEKCNVRNSDKGQDNDHDGFGTSRSVRRENSSENNQQDSSAWKPKLNLNEAPSTPLLLLLMDNRGKSMSGPDQFDPVSSSKNLANEIGNNLDDPNSITDEQTLEKFTILATLLRTMNTQQIDEAQREIYQSYNQIDSHDASRSVGGNSWAAFRDAVAQAGTGPALVTIKNWIKEGKIKGVEAASVVAVLSKTARAPTPEYLNAFFEMVTMPETTNEEYLNSTAMITFGELIRYSQVNHNSAQNHHSINSFDRPKHNSAIFRDYIPYISEQLKKSIENKEFARSHAFIRALGNIAHPKILTIFEPYLEREIPASTFQRLLMVFSMNNLASLRPRLARGVFYRIYQNTAETHQLRSAAVAFLMSTNPPASMLQRMAEFTNHDHSRSVNAAVKSAIESASKLERPESQDLATKARNVLSLLSDESYDNEYSINYFSDYAASEWNLDYSIKVFMAHNNLINLALHETLEAKYGDIEIPKAEIGALLSSLTDVYTALMEARNGINGYGAVGKEFENNVFSPKYIAKMLKIDKNDNENLEATFWTNSKYDNKFVSFDMQRLLAIPGLFWKAANSVKEGRDFNVVKMESYDLTLSFPMESGFPFIYTMKSPVMLKLSGSLKGEDAGKSINVFSDLHLLYSMQIQGRLGFVTPFEHQHYMAGVNKNLQAYAPIRTNLTFDGNEKRVTLKFQPIDQNKKYRLAHYSLVPFTSRHNILNMSPVIKDKETRKLINGNVWHRVSRLRNLNFEMEAESSRLGSMDRSNWDPVARLIFALAEDNPEYGKAEISLEPDESGEQSIILTALLDVHVDYTTTYDENRSKASPKATAPIPKSKKLCDTERRKEFIKEASKGISEVTVMMVDLGVEIPGDNPSQMMLTAAYALSMIDEKSRGLAYWRVVDPQMSIEAESCAGLELKLPRTYTLKSQDRLFLKDESKFRSFDVDFRLGTTCESGFKFEIHGDQEQTELYKRAVIDLPVISKCMEDVSTGAKSTPVCIDAGDMIYTMDKSHVTIKFDPKIYGFQDEVHKYFIVFNKLFPIIKSSVTANVNSKESIDRNVLDLSMNVNLPNNVATLSCQTSEHSLVIEDFTFPFGLPIRNLHFDLSDANERMIMNLSDVDSIQRTCEFVSDKAITFDNATYPVNLGKCWHVALTNYPIAKIRTWNNFKSYRYVSVLVRDSKGNNENTNKDVMIFIDDYKLQLTFGGAKILTRFGEIVDLNDKNSTEYLNFELLEEADGSVKFSYPQYEFELLYDGKRIQIKASEDYRNDIRGLCGNYDGEPTNDFMSPRDCALSKSEEFVASYALTSNDCEGPAIENSKKAHNAVCNHKTVRLGNVVTDRDVGRSKIKI